LISELNPCKPDNCSILQGFWLQDLSISRSKEGNLLWAHFKVSMVKSCGFARIVNEFSNWHSLGTDLGELTLRARI
jgi:hypothetical protein